MPFRFASQAALLALTPACLFAQQPARLDHSAEPHGINLAFMDRAISPTVDFYRFSNGFWLDRTSIPHDAPAISATAQARQRNEELIWRVVSGTAFDYSAPKGSPEQIVGEFLRTGLDQDQADRLRSRPIDSEVHRIAAIQTRGDLMAEFARLHRRWINVGFHPQVDFDFIDSSHKILSIYQGGLSLHARDRYLGDDSRGRNLRAKLVRCVEKTLILVGDSPESVARSAQRVLAIETRMAQAWSPEAETGQIEANFHRVSRANLAAISPGLNWNRYFEELGAKDIATVNVGQAMFLQTFGDLVAHVPIRDWQTYLRWRLAASAAPFLSSEFAQLSFELDSALTGQEITHNRREIALEAADNCLGEELGMLLARTQFAMESKPKVLSMVSNIRAALRETIDGLDWMAPNTKAKAIEKLDRMQVDVCYPDRWPDCSALDISDDSFVQNVFRAREFGFQRGLDSLAKPVDRKEWDVRAYAVDAHYNPSLNAIVLPAGVLQPPYFDIKADDASNYGSFGTVIGHEMMHAFDGRGRKFDALGNLNNWWSDSDGMRYDEQQKGFVAQYNSYPMMDRQTVNGKLTLEENVADLGGVMASFAALKRSGGLTSARKIDGFTPGQRFFISFGQLFRAKTRPECERLELESDPHSPPKFRVKGVLQNVPEFWKAFDAIPPKTFLRIW